MIIVQIGCNDGKDHVLDFCINNKESICEIHLVEPNPEALEDCKQTYLDFNQAKFYNLAIVPNDVESINLYIPQVKYYNGHASTITNHLVTHGHTSFNTINVLASTIAGFFDSNKITKCDRLYIDTEGLDCEIILNFDIEKYRIGRIEFETLHTDGVFTKGQNYNSCVEKLKALGYGQTEAAQYNEAYQLYVEKMRSK
jgi:FkbM family methyltransferase